MLIQYLINVKPLFVAYSPRPDEVMIVRYVQPLTDEQRALLEKTMKEDTACRARSRAHSLLLSAGGTPIQTIARTSQVHRVTVSAWIKKWEQHGAQSLPDHPRSGRPPTLTPDEQELAKGRVPIFPVRLRAEPGAKWPYVSTGSTAPPCSTSARARWPRHWHDTRTCSVLSSAG